MKILVLSTDQTLGDSLADDLRYAVERVNNDEAAAAYLNQHNDVIGLVIDAQAWPKAAGSLAHPPAHQTGLGGIARLVCDHDRRMLN